MISIIFKIIVGKLLFQYMVSSCSLDFILGIADEIGDRNIYTATTILIVLTVLHVQKTRRLMVTQYLGTCSRLDVSLHNLRLLLLLLRHLISFIRKTKRFNRALAQSLTFIQFVLFCTNFADFVILILGQKLVIWLELAQLNLRTINMAIVPGVFDVCHTHSNWWTLHWILHRQLQEHLLI